MTDKQVAEYVSKLGVKAETKLYDLDIRKHLMKLNMLGAWETVTSENPFKRIFRQEAPYLLTDVLKWAFIEQQGIDLSKQFEKIFGECYLLEHYTTRFLFKVGRNNHSIGFVFGVMEELKPKFSISEYSASQTTLEQIFNMFAR